MELELKQHQTDLLDNRIYIIALFMWYVEIIYVELDGHRIAGNSIASLTFAGGELPV